MKKNHHLTLFRTLLVLLFLSLFTTVAAQGPTYTSQQPSNFWKNVQFGGGIGLNFSSGYTDLFLAPSAIYNFNPTVALGAGLNLNYVSSNNYYSSFVYGISTIVLINLILEIQFSVVLNEFRAYY